MTTKIPFSKGSRADGLPRSWDFSIREGYEDVTGLIDIAEELLDIPVRPLPDPLVPGNEPWHTSMNISGYEFADTWEQYLDVLREHGTIRRSGTNSQRLRAHSVLSLSTSSSLRRAWKRNCTFWRRSTRRGA